MLLSVVKAHFMEFGFPTQPFLKLKNLTADSNNLEQFFWQTNFAFFFGTIKVKPVAALHFLRMMRKGCTENYPFTFKWRVSVGSTEINQHVTLGCSFPLVISELYVLSVTADLLILVSSSISDFDLKVMCWGSRFSCSVTKAPRLSELTIRLGLMPWLHLQATQADGLCLGLPVM